MRTPVVVLAIALLALPSTLFAQQREPAPPTADSAAANTAPDAAPRQGAAPKSLMGMVMATLIESAEQRQAPTQRTKPTALDATRAPVQTATATTDEPDEAAPAEQVAVQTVP